MIVAQLCEYSENHWNVHFHKVNFMVFDFYLYKSGGAGIIPIHDTAVAASVWHHMEGSEKPKQTFPTPHSHQRKKAALLFIQKDNSSVPRIPYAILNLMNTTKRLSGKR